MKSRGKLIKVTKKHIAEGQPRHGAMCPVALAIREAEYDIYCVRSFVFEIIKDKERVVVTPSRKVRRFIKAFDAGKLVEPINFYLTLP